MYKSISKITLTITTLAIAGNLSASSFSLDKFNFNSLSDLINTERSNQKFKFGNEYLKAECSIPSFEDMDLGFGGICGVYNKTVDKANKTILDILNKNLNLGICQISSDVDTKCQANFLKEICNNLDKEVQEISKKAKNEKDAFVKNMSDTTKKKFQNTMSVILSDSEKYLTVTGGDRHQKQNSKQCSSVNLGKNYKGESIKKTLDSMSVLYTNILSSNSSNAATEAIMRCLKQFPIANANENDIKLYYDICSPSNQTRASQSEIYENTVMTAKQMAKVTMPSYASSKVLGSQITADLAGYSQCAYKTTLEEAELCQQAYLQNKTEASSGIGQAAALESEYIKTAEENTAMTLAILENIYPDKIKDTSDQALKKILPAKRGYFLAQAQKQDLKNALVMSYANRIAEAKKELARIAFAKIKECATPFYYQAALSDIDNMVTNAKKEAESVVNSILNDKTVVKP